MKALKLGGGAGKFLMCIGIGCGILIAVESRVVVDRGDTLLFRKESCAILYECNNNSKVFFGCGPLYIGI